MVRERLLSFAENERSIINERIKLFMIKIECFSTWNKTKNFIINMKHYNIQDYVRLKYLLGEPL